MKPTSIIWTVLILLVVLGGGWYWYSSALKNLPTPALATSDTTVLYACNAGKSITAVYQKGDTPPPVALGQPPKPTGSVSLKLSDGRMMTLPQTISASGIRYSDGDPNTQGSETFVFWSKGNTALVLENNEEKSFTGCIAVAPDPGGLPNIYPDIGGLFTARYPATYMANPSYQYDNLGPKEPKIPGVKFTIPASMATGTNLSSFDTGVSIETMPNMPECTAYPFLIQPQDVHTEDINGTNYSVATASGAGAGNLYEETVYALMGTNPCLAVRYFIHSTQVANYPEGTVTAFDKAALLKQFDAIRDSLTLSR